jgi:hypothetical protein
MLTLFFSILPGFFLGVGCLWAFSLSARSADGKAMFAGVTLGLAISFVFVLWVLTW